MSIASTSLGRVSNLMRGNRLGSTLARTQSKLDGVQNELSSGRRLNKVSDDVGDGSVAQSVRKLLEKRVAYGDNLSAANGQLSEVDTNLGEVSDLMRQAQTLASANVGSDALPAARDAAAAQIDSIYDQILSLANTESNGVFLYGGDRSTAAPFVEENGGVRWVGSSTVLSNQYDESVQLDFMVDGASIFGAVSGRVQGATDLAPSVSAATRLADLNGATNAGVRPGLFKIDNGTTSATVDLADADSLGDVVNRINAASVGGITASINAAGNGIDLTAGAADELAVTDLGGGTGAADLGIARPTTAGAGVALAGADVGGKVTPLTPLSALKNGAGIDTAGLRISVDGIATDVDLSGATTVEDLVNKINGSGTNAVAKINASGTGIDVLNAVQGTRMSIAEIGGGTTAADLGVRSFDGQTAVAELNRGKGLTLAPGNELRLTDSAGIVFEVDLDGATLVQDVLDKINAAATAAGAGVTAGVSTTGNGLTLADTAGGTGTLSVGNVNGTSVVGELGLGGAAVGGAITGSDTAPVESTGVFATLDRLRKSLRSDDQAEITRAAEVLDDNLAKVVLIRGQVGAKVQAFESRESRLDDQNLASKALLSQLEDTDFTDAIIRFQTLQTSLQATMQSASKTLNLSLMDFLG